MTQSSDIAADPTWLPHRIDTASRQVEFLRIDRPKLADQGFLADRNPGPSDRTLLSWDEVLAMQPDPGPLHFLFHTAFCRSTLLVRVLDAPGVAVGLNEPGIIASMVNAGPQAATLHKPLLDLLSRSHTPGETVFVKPTNHANALMPALLTARPDARATLMTNPLSAFLASVARKGLMGRRWGRQLFLEMQGYAGMDFGMDGRESFAMTDLQASGLAWFLAQRWFQAHLSGGVKGVAPERLRVLDSDRFIDQRERTLADLLAFAGVDRPKEASARMATSDVFGSHAKLGGSFKESDEAGQTAYADEIDQVGQWVSMIAQQAGLTVPVRHSLN